MFSSGVNIGGGGRFGGGVAGSNTQIQYNNSGVLGASANFKWDETNKRLNLAANNSFIQFGTIGYQYANLCSMCIVDSTSA